MSSQFPFLHPAVISVLLHLLLIVLVAVVVNRFLRVLTKLIIHPAKGQARAEQAREQQTKTLAAVVYGTASKVVWGVAILTALDKIGINPIPALTFTGLAGVAVGFGAQNLVRDLIGGFYIVFEDQFVVGDTVQIGETTGRVEHLTLRRTVLRDERGALVTIGNGEIRRVANLSRDWSQAFVDVALAPEVPLEKTLGALEVAAAQLRGDAAWSLALVEGPRVLGVQNYDRAVSLVRLQVKTLPTRDDEIARELRRRIQLEFQKQGIPLASVLRCELVSPQGSGGAAPLSPRLE